MYTKLTHFFRNLLNPEQRFQFMSNFYNNYQNILNINFHSNYNNFQSITITLHNTYQPSAKINLENKIPGYKTSSISHIYRSKNQDFLPNINNKDWNSYFPPPLDMEYNNQHAIHCFLPLDKNDYYVPYICIDYIFVFFQPSRIQIKFFLLKNSSYSLILVIFLYAIQFSVQKNLNEQSFTS